MKKANHRNGRSLKLNTETLARLTSDQLDNTFGGMAMPASLSLARRDCCGGPPNTLTD